MTGATQPAASAPAAATGLKSIEHFIVLMLENRSFDQLLGALKASDPRIAGLTGQEFNYRDPRATQPVPVPVTPATAYTMPFDPAHEFPDVQVQLYGPSDNVQQPANLPVDPAPMSGFAYSAVGASQSAHVPAAAPRIMECFQPEQVPVMATLAREFALCNFWYSSLPGPTWPNRFFIHAGTSGGLTDSPGKEQIVAGFLFENGTIYERLRQVGEEWRIYHDGFPQAFGLANLQLTYFAPFSRKFRRMSFFEEDMKESLPAYVFIEPRYDDGHNYVRGNSMHPLNDIREGERLVKRVYEGLRGSQHWATSMLIITFDEHGGFYDHLAPPAATPTGDDTRYAHADRNFAFDRLGVRVPALVVSPFTRKGTVIGRDPTDPTTRFDHTSVLATVEKRYGIKPLTRRDAAAQTLEAALNLTAARTDAPLTLPSPVSDSVLTRIRNFFRRTPAAAAKDAPLSENQKSLLAVALACDLKLSDQSKHAAVRERHGSIARQKDAAKYMAEIEQRVLKARGE